MTDQDKPQLGLATTRELLVELKARGETEVYYRELGDEMAIGASNLGRKLPGSMLEYRTVDGRRTPKNEAISRLAEAEFQLLALTPEALRREPGMLELIARDIRKAREIMEERRG